MTTVTTQAELDAAVAAGDIDGPIVLGSGGPFNITAGVEWLSIAGGVGLATPLLDCRAGADTSIECLAGSNPWIICRNGSAVEIDCLRGAKPFIHLYAGCEAGVVQREGSDAVLYKDPLPTEPEGENE